MLLVIAGTNRPGSNTLKVARGLLPLLEAAGATPELLDLMAIPAGVFEPASYARKPAAFQPFQAAVDRCEGILTVVPEYNGSFPGALKYFLDLLAFPGSLAGVPCAFVGLSAGRWGGVRAVEQLEQVFLYRKAQPYAQRVFLPGIHGHMNGDGLEDPALQERLEELARGFARFVANNPRAGSAE